MNGRERPCENSTTNTAILPLGYAFRQEYVLAPISGESFSAGLLTAKTTEVRAKGLAPLGFASEPLACPQVSRGWPPPLAYRELHEWRGETVRKLDHKYCHIVVRLCFCIRRVLTTYFRESFSVGLRRAKITEVRAKEGLCLSLSRSDLPQTSRLLRSGLPTQELHEWRGEAVRKRPQILPTLQPDYFFAQGMCLYIFVGSFSVGLRLAKITEACAKTTVVRAKCSDPLKKTDIRVT